MLVVTRDLLVDDRRKLPINSIYKFLARNHDRRELDDLVGGLSAQSQWDDYRARQPVDFVDHDHVDATSANVVEQPFEVWSGVQKSAT